MGEMINVNHIPIKVWLIACTNQLGLELARRALQDGDCVTIGHCETADELQNSFPETLVLVDLGAQSRSLCFTAVAETIRRFGRIDVLVYQPSVMIVGPLQEMREALLREQLYNSYYAAANLINASIRVFCNQNSGHIINITDVTGELAMPCLGIWASAIRAIEGFTESTGLSLSSYNVRVTTYRAPLEVSLSTIVGKFPVSDQVKSNPTGLELRARNLFKNMNVFPTVLFDQTIEGILTIAGSKDPPAVMHVGMNAINQIKEKLNQISEDLEEFA